MPLPKLRFFLGPNGILVKSHSSVPFLSWSLPKWQIWVHSIWDGHWPGPPSYLLGSMTSPPTTSHFNSLLPIYPCYGSSYTWSFWKNILQFESMPSIICLQFRNQLFLQVFMGLCTGPAPFVPRTLGAHRLPIQFFTCFLSHLQESRLLSGSNSWWFRNIDQPSTVAGCSEY